MPTAEPGGSDVLGVTFTPGYDPSSWACEAHEPPTCQGTDWPPMTPIQRYAEDRRLGQRVPPSVTTWRPQDVRRQQDADAMARSQVTGRAAGAPVSPGPGCEGRDR
jgi:hypothetical protein